MPRFFAEPDLMIGAFFIVAFCTTADVFDGTPLAIGGGGFIPARIIRSFLKVGETKRNIPIQAIGLSLYEALPDVGIISSSQICASR